MRYQIENGTVSLGGKTILNHIDFSIKGQEKIAVVGRNGAGKTTLLRLISGELSLDRDDKRFGKGITTDINRIFASAKLFKCRADRRGRNIVFSQRGEYFLQRKILF